MDKIKLKVVSTFSGIGMQERAIENTRLFDMEVVNTCEMDSDAIVSYAAIHHNLTKEEVENYDNYPPREEMAQQLADKHIGYDFVKDKPYDWQKLARSKDSKMRLQTVWLADRLNKNVGDIMRVEKFPQCDLLTFSFPCFTADTKIKTPNGLKNINEFIIGDFIEIDSVFYEVTNTFDQGIKKVGDLSFDDGYTVTCTPNHKFLVEENITKRIWVKAEDLTPDHKIVMDRGYGRITKFDNFREEHVYDITVDDVHCFALENGIIASNCTDLSIAGRQAGMVEGETRSGLVYEVLRILKNMKAENNLPTFLLMENVDALVNKKNKPQYEALNEEFSDLGYDVKWQVLNGKNCGVPQNRSRIFAIYWLRDKIDLSTFEFPLPFDDGRRLKDVLLDEVDEKYYITNERAQALIRDLVMNGKVVPTDETVKKK